MPFDNKEGAEARLRDTAPLTRQDVNDLIPYLGAIGGGLTWRIIADLSLQNITAVEKFDESSTRLSNRLLWLTWIIAALTAVAAIPVIRSLCK
jgi:hypothetical protein